MSTKVMDRGGVRALRGDESRAAFARRLGVTAQTVYRWELPDDAAEARRPRGEVLERLRRLADGAATAPARSGGAGDAAASSAAFAAFARFMQGEWRDAEPELLRAVMEGPDVSEDAAAVGAAGLAFAETFLRADARAAFAALGPALAAASRDRLTPGVAAIVYAVGAIAHAIPDARFFDLGRVNAYQARVEALAGHGASSETRLLAGLGAGWAAVVSGDHELLVRAFDGLDQIVVSEPPLALSLLIDESAAFRALIFGRPAEAARLFEALAARADAAGASLVAARSWGSFASRLLEDLAPPERALEHARRAHDRERAARAAAGLHTMFAARAEIEALFRLGRLEEARAALATVDAYWGETGLPPTGAISAYVRLAFLESDRARLEALVERLRACDVPGVRRLARACALYVEAALALGTGGDAQTALAAFASAEREAALWPFLVRELVTWRPMAFVLDPELPNPDAALRHAQRVLDGFPSPWASAHLRRAEGMIRATRGQLAEGRRLLQAARATFEAAGCVPDVALVTYGLALTLRCEGAPDADARVAEAEAAVLALGMRTPQTYQRAIERARQRGLLRRAESAPPPREPTSSPSPIEALAVGLQRLLVPGAAAPLVQRELLSVAAALFPGRAPRLEELDSNRAPHAVPGSAPAGDDADVTWVELGDGAGRRLRLGVPGPLSAAEHGLLASLALAAGAALQIAALRGLSARGDRTPEEEASALPGFIAASPAMRRLRADLARFASSRATVIITGESGTGKEVVARAIHDLSTRAGRPYVAFNCAAVPRELFEGQLFGHRKGAFTGATADQPGTIRAADGGTLFLDEIGELPLDVQPKLLRFLENGEVSPLGERRPVSVDVRIVAATHRDLESLVRQGKFREDLFFRLQVIPVRVPPLRERREDVAALARHFARELGPKGRAPVLAPDALAALVAHAWPGNVRELRNVIERTLAYTPDAAVVTATDLRFE
ncbi:MAG TPA: sigma-54 dependent transcriptional regulator [Polyangia bacterium]|nr:sigma-54 dependent transcriptional regulator [Polyangia bacterium]